MTKKNILLICGGGGTEHEISLLSAEYIYSNLEKLNYNIFYFEICKDGVRRTREGKECELRKSGDLYSEGETISIDFIIPCLHGPPGETGDIQSVFELMGVPYLGAGPEASILAFNKVSTKLWMNALEIPNTPFLFASKNEDRKIVLSKATDALKKWKSIFIKASSQGSSVGCYKIDSPEQLEETIQEAFQYSPYLLFEKAVVARELEIALFEVDGKITASDPGEINCPEGFYTYEEKYNPDSHTTTSVLAEGISSREIQAMKKQAIHLFHALNIKHLARVDFFYTEDKNFFINEINTFPGMTKISMFPKMLENAGHSFSDFLDKIISQNIK